MKTLIAFLVLLALLFPTVSHAAERPVLRGEMTETDRKGNVLQTLIAVSHKLTLFKDGHKATAFELESSQADRVSLYRMENISARRNLCGSVKYSGYKRYDRKRWVKIEVTDHTQRICKDYQPYGWKAVFQEAGKAKRYFQGNPKSADDVDCAKYNESKTCILIYQPTKCALVAYSGVPVTEQLHSEGANTCVAINTLNQIACEAGYNPDWFDDTDVMCKFTPKQVE